MAHVEDANYLPVKATPSTGQCSITNNGASAVALDQYAAMVSNEQVSYLITEPATINPGMTVDVPVSQLTYQVLTAQVTSQRPFYQVRLSKDITAKVYQMNVYVDIGDGYAQWDLARKFQNVDSDDHVYDEFYTHLGQIGIMFGNGIFGLMPPVASLAKIEAWLTEGQTYLASNQPLTLVSEAYDGEDNIADLTIVSNGIVSGGSAMESTESIAGNLQYWPLYNENIIWKSDYVYFLKREFENILWLNVWGEKEAEEAAGAEDLAFVNKIYVSAYAEGGADISIDVIEALEAATTETNRKFEWVAPSLESFTVMITGTVGKNRNLTTVASAISEVLEQAYGLETPAEQRKALVRIKELYTLIDDTGYFSGNQEIFEVTLAGTTSPTDLNSLVHIDLSSSTITIEHEA